MLADCFARAGELVWVDASMTADQRAEAVALVAQMAGELSRGAVQALQSGNHYAASALTRQVIETQYLLALFSTDDTAAVRWLTASSNQIDQHFRPGQMRKAGGFSPSEYKVHCQLGGHPDPHGRWLLPGHTPAMDLALQWVDLAQHLGDAWGFLIGCLKDTPQAVLVLDLVVRADAAWVQWRDADPMAGRVPRPEGSN